VSKRHAHMVGRRHGATATNKQTHTHYTFIVNGGELTLRLLYLAGRTPNITVQDAGCNECLPNESKNYTHNYNPI